MTYCANTQCSAYGNCNLFFDCPLFKPTREKPKGNKYQAQKCVYNGEKFDSRKELQRWLELRLLERSGQIMGLKRQIKFELIPAQKDEKGKCVERACVYVADFTYFDKNKKLCVEDCKGYKGGGAYAVFTIKRKLMLLKYGIKIKEV